MTKEQMIEKKLEELEKAWKMKKIDFIENLINGKPYKNTLPHTFLDFICQYMIKYNDNLGFIGWCSKKKNIEWVKIDYNYIIENGFVLLDYMTEKEIKREEYEG